MSTVVKQFFFVSLFITRQFLLEKNTVYKQKGLTNGLQKQHISVIALHSYLLFKVLILPADTVEGGISTHPPLSSNWRRNRTKIAPSLRLFVLHLPPGRAAPVHLFTDVLCSSAVWVDILMCQELHSNGAETRDGRVLSCKVNLDAKPKHTVMGWKGRGMICVMRLRSRNVCIEDLRWSFALWIVVNSDWHTDSKYIQKGKYRN